jgi:D-3-phosphoglycerate dehydrogenase
MSLKILSMADISPFPDALDALRDCAEVHTLPPERAALENAIHDYDAYIATLKVRFDRDILGRAKRLKAIATPSTGTDHIDLEEARRRGVEVISLKNDTGFLDKVTATAELAWGLLLGAARKIPWAFESARSGVWGRDAFRGAQLSGKTLGIIGLGRLGRIVASYGLAFRMRVIACDIKDQAPPAGVVMRDFDSVLKDSDFISLHVHLTPENTGLIGGREFSLMKKGVVIVNTSRGAVINEAAFLDALLSGKVAAAGIDVIDGEWSENLKDHPIIKHAAARGNLLITPHIGGVTLESQEMTIRRTAEKLRAFFAAGL